MARQPTASPAVRTVDNGDSSAARGLSSIARNRRANRGVPNPTPSGAGDIGLGDMGPRLRNLLEDSVAPGEEPEFNYPDIHADPAKIYHDRFGIDEEHDRFVFPWLMNLIFEDRWLLAEKDPVEALRNQFRRRMKIDIRDPDPDTANFPNGAYTLPKGRMYIENSPVGFYGASQNTPTYLPVGISAPLRTDRQPRVPHLLQRVHRAGGAGETARPAHIKHAVVKGLR